jgi:predicted enzyme related to lactoylglutathione lyase
VHYLEVVTTDVDAACKLYATMHGVTFGDVDQNLGGARTTRLADGGMIGVRAPMHDGEKPVTRAYVLVEDIEAAVAAAAASGAVIAVPPMEIAGHGTCAIYFQGGIEAGLWQL